MRPRSRLLSKRRLMLPTIREGTEETVRDLNEANTLHNWDRGQAVSSEDYLLSICHLACPTFPTTDVSPDNFHTRQQDAMQRRLRPSRLIGESLTTFEINLNKEAHNNNVQQGEEKELNGELLYGNSDPLEYIYGHQNNLSDFSGRVRKAFVERKFVRYHESVCESRARTRANSIPHALNPDFPHHHKGTFPEICTNNNTSVPNISPKNSLIWSEARRVCPADRGAEGQMLNPAKQSIISQWLSDCRSVWRVARVQACMLPAIAEV
ncbi:uncharacterized protein [Leuresthes tenuis]|uniref:uncharacterized protein n=1 Tax=Leuresthes tenuis TaxID=355514 RepID=UPI003B510BDB